MLTRADTKRPAWPRAGVTRAAVGGRAVMLTQEKAGMGKGDHTEATVRVELGTRSYPIHIGAGIAETIGIRLRESDLGPRIAILTSTTVGSLYGDRIQRSLEEAGLAPMLIQIRDGEQHKNLETLAWVYDQLVAAQLDRSATLVALGGGVVGDIGGLAAATFLRGIALVQVPTTLVGQVDASVGGKTAVNHAAGKNLIGAFYQPRLVLTDVSLLASLPRRELMAGLSEVIKYAIILDAEFFEFLESDIERAANGAPGVLLRIVSACCRLKARVVAEDERESGRRAILNFGHTLGHAIEASTGYGRYLHGEAVAMGMVAAAELSARLGCCSNTTSARIRRLVERAGLPVDVPRDIGSAALAAAVGADKKRRDDKVKFVCIEAVGRTRFELLDAGEIVACRSG